MIALAARLMGGSAVKIGLLGGVLALGAGYVLSLRAANAELRAEAARLERERAALGRQAAARGRAVAALEASLAEARDLAAQYDALKIEVRDAPPGDDAPMAPVLARAFERLRERPGGDDFSAP